jgi:hypothetical protein
MAKPSVCFPAALREPESDGYSRRQERVIFFSGASAAPDKYTMKVNNVV